MKYNDETETKCWKVAMHWAANDWDISVMNNDVPTDGWARVTPGVMQSMGYATIPIAHPRNPDKYTYRRSSKPEVEKDKPKTRPLKLSDLKSWTRFRQKGSLLAACVLTANSGGIYVAFPEVNTYNLPITYKCNVSYYTWKELQELEWEYTTGAVRDPASCDFTWTKCEIIELKY